LRVSLKIGKHVRRAVNLHDTSSRVQCMNSVQSPACAREVGLTGKR
jgi:hypothetical protein